MELWIRTQDKECLTKVNHLYIDEKGNNIYEINQEDNISLGKYISKERTLEVLDDIQRFLQINLCLDLDYETADIILKSTMLSNMVRIYNMPKE